MWKFGKYKRGSSNWSLQILYRHYLKGHLISDPDSAEVRRGRAPLATWKAVKENFRFFTATSVYFEEYIFFSYFLVFYWSRANLLWCYCRLRTILVFLLSRNKCIELRAVDFYLSSRFGCSDHGDMMKWFSNKFEYHEYHIFMMGIMQRKID